MGWRTRLAARLDPQMARDARECRLMRRGESIEFKLQRRIHNQRVRLRQMEMFSGWQREARIWSRSKWLHMTSKLLRENDELRKRLGVTERFNQIGALADHVP